MPIICKPPPPVEIVKAVLDFDPLTGDLIWRRRFQSPQWSGRYAGKPAGSLTRNGYVEISFDGISYLAHRLAWLIAHGEAPDEIDHVNGNRSDNRITNLRKATRLQNKQNLKTYATNTTGLAGVTYHRPRRRYMAQITHQNQHYYLGLFDTAEEAHAAYLEAKARLHTFNPVPRSFRQN